MVHKWQKILSVMLPISGTIHHIIVICGTQLWKDDIPKHFSKNLIFWVISGLKGKKWPWMTKLCLSHSISQEAYIIWSWFLVHLCKVMISPASFLIFLKFWFLGGVLGVKRVKNEPKSLISVCHTPYLSNCRSDHCWIKTSVMCVFFVLQKWHLKLNILNILSSHKSTQMDLGLFWKKI